MLIDEGQYVLLLTAVLYTLHKIRCHPVMAACLLTRHDALDSSLSSCDALLYVTRLHVSMTQMKDVKYCLMGSQVKLQVTHIEVVWLLLWR